MSRLRHSTVTLAVLALTVAAPALAAAPAAAQGTTPPPVEFFVFTNVMTNPDADNDGTPEQRWQVQVTAVPANNCTPTRGVASYTSPWINAGEQVGASLSTTECVFRIAAKARLASRVGCNFDGQLGWTDTAGTLTGDYHDDSVLTSGRPSGATRLAVRRDPAAGCAAPHRTYFVLGGDSIVEDLPGGSTDRDLLARARRAAAVGEYLVEVEPARQSASPGCDIGAIFELIGDRSTSPQSLGATADECPSRARVLAGPAHVQVIQGRSVEFDAALPNIIVDLSSLVRIEPARISIVQGVAGSANQGEVSYTVTRSCGGAALASPAAQATGSQLYEGRFTVHSPDFPRFGPVAIYPVVATSPKSNSVVACSVTVTVGALPAGCTVAGGNSRTLTWTAVNLIQNFDFEFDISCGGAPPSSTAPPTSGTDDPATQQPSGEAAAAPGLGDVRIVARKLAWGEIEFGLQQRQEDASWGGRLLPTERLFPPGAKVGDWLVSTPVTVGVIGSAGASAQDVELRIAARLASDGRVEFGLQQRLDGAAWSDRQSPARRFFPASARVDRWLHSSVVGLTA